MYKQESNIERFRLNAIDLLDQHFVEPKYYSARVGCLMR